MTTSSATVPRVGDFYLNRTAPGWSPWRVVIVNAVDLLGAVTVETPDGRTHCVDRVTFARDYHREEARS